MSNGIYTAMTAASADARRLEDVSDRMANRDTPGYVSLTRRQNERAVSEAPEGAPRDKRMTQVQQTGVDTRPGALVQTDRPLDITLEPGSYLRVTGRDGLDAFTRAGNLHIDEQGSVFVGTRALLDEGGEQVRVPPGPVTLSRDGAFVVGTDEVARISQFQLAGELRRVGADEVRPVDENLVLPVQGGLIQSGALEMGTTDPMRAVIELVQVQRSFAHAMQAIDAYSRIDGRAAELGRIG